MYMRVYLVGVADEHAAVGGGRDPEEARPADEPPVLPRPVGVHPLQPPVPRRRVHRPSGRRVHDHVHVFRLAHLPFPKLLRALLFGLILAFLALALSQKST